MTKLSTHESAEALRTFIEDLQKASNKQADGLHAAKTTDEVIDAFDKEHDLNDETVAALKTATNMAVNNTPNAPVSLEEVATILDVCAEYLGQKKLENNAEETMKEAHDIFKKIDEKVGEKHDMYDNNSDYVISIAFWIDHIYEKSNGTGGTAPKQTTPKPKVTPVNPGPAPKPVPQKPYYAQNLVDRMNRYIDAEARLEDMEENIRIKRDNGQEPTFAEILVVGATRDSLTKEKDAMKLKFDLDNDKFDKIKDNIKADNYESPLHPASTQSASPGPGVGVAIPRSR